LNPITKGQALARLISLRDQAQQQALAASDPNATPFAIRQSEFACGELNAYQEALLLLRAVDCMDEELEAIPERRAVS